MQHVLLPAEVEWVMQREHGPNACTLMLSSLVKQLDLPLFRSVEVDQNITRLIDFYGGCERILKTPVPLSYTRCISQHTCTQLSHASCCPMQSDVSNPLHCYAVHSVGSRVSGWTLKRTQGLPQGHEPTAFTYVGVLLVAHTGSS